MRAVHIIDLDALARVFGSHDQALVDRLLVDTDEFVRGRLAGSIACGADPSAVLRAIVAGDVSGVDEVAVWQMFDVVVHALGTEASFLDEGWASDRVLTAIDKAKVHVDRGLEAPAPWPIARSSTGVPMVSIWSTADLEVLATELEAARARVAPDLADGVAAVGRALAGQRATGRQIVVVDWL